MRKPIALAIAVIVTLALAACDSCEYVSDIAKQASQTAHSQADEQLDAETIWHPSTQDADGKRLVETGAVSYGCRTRSMPHVTLAGKTTVITTMPYTTCDHDDIPYRLVYDTSGTVIDFTKENQ